MLKRINVKKKKCVYANMTGLYVYYCMFKIITSGYIERTCTDGIGTAFVPGARERQVDWFLNIL